MAQKSPYRPLKITGMSQGLIQSREEFILPNDAYPVLENAYVWRERIKRRQGYELLGRLRRVLTGQALGNLTTGTFSGNIRAILSLETDSTLQVGSLTISDGTHTWIDDSHGNLKISGVNQGTVNYSTMAITLSGGTGSNAITAAFNYFPNLPVMGLRSRELNSINVEQLIAFDTKYAYRFSNGWQEFIPGTTWTGTDYNFFWSTNYWVGNGNTKIFWVTNFSGTSGDPIRYTNGAAWINFAPQINTSGDVLAQCLAMLPFRGRLVVFNTLEGSNLSSSVQMFQRVRWSAIGTPFTSTSSIVSSGNVNATAWRDDIPGQGGYLDIPTSQSIVAVGFVRDNLVIYCERSTWQLRYTGRSISPFQIEQVNSELGAESTFSAVQFDTSLVGIGDKGVVECDSFKSTRIDIKIPDLVFEFKNVNNGTERVQGIRDFQQRLAYWTYVYNRDDQPSGKFPNRRLVYNYENDSWAIFTDSLTTLGTYQAAVSRTWATSTFPWSQANFPWLDVPAQFPSIVGGNQQGYVEYLSSNLEPKVSNDVSLFIENITGHTSTATVITSPDHNLQTGQVIQIVNIPSGTPFATSLNNKIFGIVYIDEDNFKLYKYVPSLDAFFDPQLDSPATYIGGGEIKIRDGFSIISKKFNFIDEGENIQLGFIDVLMDTTENGAISMNAYLNYNDSEPINVLPQNINPVTFQSDAFFNSVVPTTHSTGLRSSKEWKRVFCAVRGAFITIQWTFSKAQLVGVEQENDVQIDAQILWLRKAGRQLTQGV